MNICEALLLDRAIHDYVESCNLLELQDFLLCESITAKNGWSIEQTNAFKKGLKRYEKDARVMSALTELTDFVMEQNSVPNVRSYPPSLYVHQIKHTHGRAKAIGQENAMLWSHLKGQKIGVLFSVYPGKRLSMFMIGTHQEFGRK